MPLTIPDGFGEAAWIFSVAGVGTPPFVTTLGLDLSDPYDPVQLCDQLYEAWRYSGLREASSAAMVLQHTMLTIPDGGGLVSYQSVMSGYPGGSTADFAPIDNAVLINKVTGTPGRKGKGRAFIPGLLKRGDTGMAGEIDPLVAATYNGYYQSFLEIVAGSTTPWPGDRDPFTPVPVLLHSGLGDPSPILGTSTATKIGVLRKRLR